MKTNFPQQNNFTRQSRSRVPKSFIVVVLLVGVLVVINILTLGSISQALHSVGEPLWKSQAGVHHAFENILSGFRDKQTLVQKNNDLTEAVTRLELASMGAEILQQENRDLKQLLNRGASGEHIVTAILARPNRTLYDTFIVDVGSRDGVTVGAGVYGVGEVAIGTVEEVYARTTRISLYSTPGRIVEVLLGSKDGALVAAEAVGKGGGNFEIRIPRGVEILEGHPVFSPHIDGGILGVIEEIVVLPSDSFQVVLFSSPLSLQSLRFVTIALQ
ncbi:MAG: rod shape-determining protein MreC [Candidatus Paceibacterota bacterium]